MSVFNMVMIRQVGSGLVRYDHDGSCSSDADLHELVNSEILRELFEVVPGGTNCG